MMNPFKDESEKVKRWKYCLLLICRWRFPHQDSGSRHFQQPNDDDGSNDLQSPKKKKGSIAWKKRTSYCFIMRANVTLVIFIGRFKIISLRSSFLVNPFSVRQKNPPKKPQEKLLLFFSLFLNMPLPGLCASYFSAHELSMTNCPRARLSRIAGVCVRADKGCVVVVGAFNLAGREEGRYRDDK